MIGSKSSFVRQFCGLDLVLVVRSVLFGSVATFITHRGLTTTERPKSGKAARSFHHDNRKRHDLSEIKAQRRHYHRHHKTETTRGTKKSKSSPLHRKHTNSKRETL